MEQILKGFSFEQEGWQFMWVIVALGGLTIGLVVERFMYIILKCSKGRKEFMSNLAGLLKANKIAEAQSLSQSNEIPLALVMTAIISNRDKGEAGMIKAMDEIFLTEAPRINRYLALMSTLANIATLSGLLGTIYGLIYTFDAVANKPAAERPQALADGIAVAMATTFLGLVVAIPTMAAQGYFKMTAERLIEEMEEKGLKVINLL
jgi:biopolymer transport protein ExbB/TolQ